MRIYERNKSCVNTYIYLCGWYLHILLIYVCCLSDRVSYSYSFESRVMCRRKELHIYSIVVDYCNIYQVHLQCAFTYFVRTSRLTKKSPIRWREPSCAVTQEDCINKTRHIHCKPHLNRAGCIFYHRNVLCHLYVCVCICVCYCVYMWYIFVWMPRPRLLLMVIAW